MLIVPQNISAPQTLTLIFKSPSLGADLSTATTATASVLRSDGTPASYALRIVSAVPGELVCQYTPTTGDITATGVYYLTGQISVPGGTVLAQTIAMYVTSPNSSQPRTEESAWLAATSSIFGTAISTRWSVVTTTSALSPLSPWVIADTRAGVLTVSLWTARDGDTVVFSDAFGAWATHNLTIAGAVGQKVPTGSGTYGTSVTISGAGILLRWKYSAPLAQWISW